MNRIHLRPVALLSIVPWAAFGCTRLEPAVRLHQQFLEHRWREQPRLYSAPTPASRAGADFENPRSVFDYVFANLPETAVVYPTEHYFYFEFELDLQRIRGNLRFTEADQGIVHLGYYDADDVRQVRSASLGADDGVRVEPAGEGMYRVVNRGRSVQFDLAPSDAWACSVPVLEGEEFVAGIVDDSGYHFALLWDAENRSFFFVLDDGAPHGDFLVMIDAEHPRIAIGRESRFLFWRENPPGRWVLVGVSQAEVVRNSYFDGPFDQVPPRHPIGEKLRAAYPYVHDAGGIDDHGRFLQREGERVSIAPYQEYERAPDLLRLMALTSREEADARAVRRRLTYESKRDFHRTMDPDAAPGMTPVFPGGAGNPRAPSQTEPRE